MTKHSNSTIANANKIKGVVYIAPDSATPLPQSIFNRVDTDSLEWKETMHALEVEALEVEAREREIAQDIVERIDFQLGIEAD